MKRNLHLAAVFTLLAISSAIAANQEPQSRTNLGNVKGGDFKNAHSIIARKCTVCHSSEKIDMALSSGKDMNRIQEEMEKRGASLDINEREVLGIYWKEAAPLKKK